jgi:hypothetical protein
MAAFGGRVQAPIGVVRGENKAARKVKRPIAPAVETVAVEVIEQPAPGVITVTEVDGTEVREAS